MKLSQAVYVMHKSSFVGNGADIRTLVTFYVHSTSKVTSDGQPGEAIVAARKWPRSSSMTHLGINQSLAPAHTGSLPAP